MNRREFIKTASIIAAGTGTTSSLLAEDLQIDDSHIKDSVIKSRNDDKDFVMVGDEFSKLRRLSNKLYQVRRVIGYGNFNLVGLDEIVSYGRRYSKIGKFTKNDLDLLEEIFYHSATSYGFYGEKVLTKITDTINKKETIKIPYTGHYLFKGKPTYIYEKIKKEVGNEIILTSGVRGIIKQTQLFLAKAVRTNGNISKASRSLAPPGYSFHGIGDFDIGKVGYGYRNFTEDFAKTDEFKKLMDLGYISIRYPLENPFGVRYEPWHIKV
ncbi:MAG: D-alanyl-D-alanine carboxypeptidase family protein [Campylobacterales bacterium]|nr:D-alanyl-D-alanine carboxypeptidase family protein [Campylobacterales bacterium]